MLVPNENKVSDMNHKTKADYIKLATHFIQVSLVDKAINPTEKNIRHVNQHKEITSFSIVGFPVVRINYQ